MRLDLTPGKFPFLCSFQITQKLYILSLSKEVNTHVTNVLDSCSTAESDSLYAAQCSQILNLSTTEIKVASLTRFRVHTFPFRLPDAVRKRGKDHENRAQRPSIL